MSHDVLLESTNAGAFYTRSYYVVGSGHGERSPLEKDTLTNDKTSTAAIKWDDGDYTMRGSTSAE